MTRHPLDRGLRSLWGPAMAADMERVGDMAQLDHDRARHMAACDAAFRTPGLPGDPHWQRPRPTAPWRVDWINVATWLLAVPLSGFGFWATVWWLLPNGWEALMETIRRAGEVTQPW